MQRLIEEAIKPLIGLTIWGSTRAGGLQGFQFGKEHVVPASKGGTKTVGDYALHVECAWRISGTKGIVTGSRDVSVPCGENGEEWEVEPGIPTDAVGSNRRDEQIDQWLALYESSPLTVVSVSGDSVGGAVIQLSEAYALAIFPHHSLTYDYWRIFRPATSDPHFVVSGEGIWLGTQRMDINWLTDNVEDTLE